VVHSVVADPAKETKTKTNPSPTETKPAMDVVGRASSAAEAEPTLAWAAVAVACGLVAHCYLNAVRF
jgi:uncharacterized protein HemX